MEKGGMEGGREWCSLTWAHHRPCPIMCASHRSQAVVSEAAIVISIGGCLCPFGGVHVHWWVFVSIGGPSCHVHVHWWAFVSFRGCSSWHHGWCDMGPVSHVKEEKGGRGVVGLTCMHSAQCGALSSLCTGLVTWRRGIFLGVQWCRHVPWVV